MMKTKDEGTIKNAVRERYAEIARTDDEGGCCGDGATSCCGTSKVGEAAVKMGYSIEDLAGVPEGANLGLGCGNPQAIAALKTGESVLDLGSGAGFDCFLAARAVGSEGRVIGVDMTPEMIEKARRNADKGGFSNVEFRLGEIESLPVEDDAVDVIMSNCVINLAPDKRPVYREAFRVLKPGGRLAISDTVATADLPPDVKSSLSMYAGCVAGALSINEIETILAEVGFSDVRVTVKGENKDVVRNWAPGTRLEDYIASATIEAVKR